MALLGRDKEMECVTPLPLPPRYRFRDLIMGDWAFNDDGQRLGSELIQHWSDNFPIRIPLGKCSFPITEDPEQMEMKCEKTGTT
ncbi:hypothetical protein JTB14_030072 [Gonioctena quinquepunctata]|nr:hypothetical protein JTB14_030072 [Gonioctena quinquepunctata]